MDEKAEKRLRLTDFMVREGYEAVVFTRQAGIAWYLCGARPYVSMASENASATLIVTLEKDYLLTTNIEAPRFRDEEPETAGLELLQEPWHDKPSLRKDLLAGRRAASDAWCDDAVMEDKRLARLRYALTPAEVERYRALGAAVADALQQTAFSVRRGWSEHEVAADMAGGLLARGVSPVTLLVAADERLSSYRHPLPTAKRVERVLMLVACARAGGLIVSLSRIVHFGPVASDLRRRHAAVTAIDAAMIDATRPGTPVADIFELLCRVYAEEGYAEEWKLHHQGGATGYAGRDYKALPDSEEIVQPWQAFAWNPSITGTKSEDTMLASPEGPIVVSGMAGWPMLETRTASVRRPDILTL